MVDSLKWAQMPLVRDDVKPLTIVHLFPELLNLYGDGGNVIALTRRLQWRGLPVEVREVGMGDTMDFSQADIVFIGGGADREQMIVKDAMAARKNELSAYVSDGGVLLAVCGGYQFLASSISKRCAARAASSATRLSKATYAKPRSSASRTMADARRSAPTRNRSVVCSAKRSATMAKTVLKACIRAISLELTCMVLCCRKTRRSPIILLPAPSSVAASRSNLRHSMIRLNFLQIE